MVRCHVTFDVQGNRPCGQLSLQGNRAEIVGDGRSQRMGGSGGSDLSIRIEHAGVGHDYLKLKQKRGYASKRNPLISVVRPAGFEPAAYGFVVRRSIRAELRARSKYE